MRRYRMRQGQLFDEADRHAEMERSIEEKQEELARSRRRYEEIRISMRWPALRAPRMRVFEYRAREVRWTLQHGVSSTC